MKIKVAGSNIEQAQEVKASQSGIRAFSKVVDLGHDYRLICPIDPVSIEAGKPSMMSASFPVRSLSEFVKGNTYILEDWDVDEMTGRYIDHTALAPYEGISRVLHKAMCSKDKQKKKAAMVQDAKDNGDDINSPEFIGKQAVELNKIEILYNGDMSSENKIYAKKKPLVGAVRTYTCTEFFIVPINDGIADYKNAEIASYDISSGAKLTKLSNAFKLAYKPGDKFVELNIQYGYNCTKHSEAGQQLSFEAVSDDKKLSALNPAKWAEFESELDKLAKSAEQMAARSTAARYTQPAEHLITALKEYISRIPGIFSCIDFDDTSTKYAAQSMLDSGIVTDKSVQEKLLSLVQEGDAEDAGKPEDEQSEDFNAAVVTKATNLDALEEAVRSTSSTGDLSALDSEELDAM